jgi:hypothetical protein
MWGWESYEGKERSLKIPVLDSGCPDVDGEGRNVVDGLRAGKRVIIRERQSPHIVSEAPPWQRSKPEQFPGRP